MKKTIICLIGPTAVGKSEVALKLAQKLNAEIISCDSMQVYQGADIATSKPSKKEQGLVSHHLIDILKPAQSYNAERFRRLAEKVICDIHKRDKLPLIVGGTGLYLRALLDGLFRGPAQNLELRKKLTQQAKKYGAMYLYRKLVGVDKAAAGKIHPNDIKRVIRALEVYLASRVPISKLHQKTKGIRDKYKLYLFGLQRPRDELYGRIEKRVDKMFRAGLVREIERLLKVRMSKTAKLLLGYREIKGFLNGECSNLEARDLLKKNTRHYAKRQLTWFRKEKGVRWIKVEKGDTAEAIAKKIHSFLV